METQLFKILEKAGPFIGPRGGLWADPQHTIPYRETMPKRTVPHPDKPDDPVYHQYKHGETRHWVNAADDLGYRPTNEAHKEGGDYKPERKALHRQIVKSFVAKAPPVDPTQKPTAVVMMGGPAAGKGTVLKHIMGTDEPADLVNVNPDDVKKQLPEYQKLTAGLGTDPKSGKPKSAVDAAFLTHVESSEVSKQVLASAVENRQNVMLDGTGKNLKTFLPKIQKLKDAGYHVMLVMPHITAMDAQQRAINRAEHKGRYVPPEIVDRAHALISGNFRKVAAQTDEFVLFDNNKPPPRPVLSGARGQSDTVHDPQYMQEFFQYAKRQQDYGRSQGWIKSWVYGDLQKAGVDTRPPSITLADILNRVKKNRGDGDEYATGLDEFWDEWKAALNVKKSQEHLLPVLKKSKKKNSVEPDKTKRTGGRQLHDRVKFRGLDISIENRAGSVREWYDPDKGEYGETLMSTPYGYVRGSVGQDGDHVDVYVGPNELAPEVYVINQMKRPEFVRFDEQKCMLGFDSPGEAKAVYLSHFDDERFFGTMQTMPFEEFKEKVLATNGRNRLVRAYRIHGMQKSSKRGESFSEATVARIARKLGIAWEEVDWTLQDLRQGMIEELEHRDVTDGDPIDTAKIAIAHLRERADYYQRLSEMEKKPLKKGGKYYGPRGGVYADPQHTIPYKEPKARTKKVSKQSARKKWDRDWKESEATVHGFVTAGSVEAFDALGPHEHVNCARCGSNITNVFLTEKGPIGGDCLATVTGDNTTRSAFRKISKKFEQVSQWYSVGRIWGVSVESDAHSREVSIFAHYNKKNARIDEWSGEVIRADQKRALIGTLSSAQASIALAIASHLADSKKLEVDNQIEHLLQKSRGGGPFIGPRGGLWEDPQHTIPYKKPTKKKPTQISLFGEEEKPSKEKKDPRKIKEIMSVVDTREYEEVDDRYVPIRGSGELSICDRCGKGHEVHATVLLESGKTSVVGTGCMRAESADTQSKIRSLTSASKTLARLRAKEKGLQAILDNNQRIRLEVEKLSVPEITVKYDPEDEWYDLYAGDARTVSFSEKDIPYSKKQLVHIWQERRYREMGGTSHYRHQLEELQRRITKITKKMGKLLGKSFPEPELMKAEGGGPFIGPRGGKWADPQHTIPWEVDVTPHKALFDRAEPTKFHVKDLGNDQVRLSRHEDREFGPTMHRDAVKHFVNDIEGRVELPKHDSHAAINAVIEGKAQHLGKGDDGVAYKVGDQVVKVSTTVPYQPENPGHRHPDDAIKMLKKQVEVGNKLAKKIPGIQESEFVQHGDKGFQIKPYVEIPDKWTKEQLDQIQDTIIAMHKEGYAMHDEIQPGLHEGKPVMYDVGKAGLIHRGGTGIYKDADIEDDFSSLKRLYNDSGLGDKFVRRDKDEGEQIFDQIRDKAEKYGKDARFRSIAVRHLKRAVELKKHIIEIDLEGEEKKKALEKMEDDLEMITWELYARAEEGEEEKAVKEILGKSLTGTYRLVKAQKYYGPKGGVYADPQHKIPYKEPHQTSLFGEDDRTPKITLPRTKGSTGPSEQDKWKGDRRKALDAYNRLKDKIEKKVIPGWPTKVDKASVTKMLRYLEAGLPGTGVEAHPVIGSKYGERILLKLIQGKGSLK